VSVADSSEAFDGLHRRNLSKLLRLVHLHARLSRAQLTAITGLNRSTVASLSAELVELGLVIEIAPDVTNRVGRPSPVIVANPRVVAIAVNPEVDALTIGIVGLDGAVIHRARIELTAVISPEATAALVGETIEGWRSTVLADSRVVAIGFAVPGLVRAHDGLVRFAPHLGWTDAALGDLASRATGILTVVGNDANLGALAEHLFGAGRDVNDLVYLNGGPSGIGGGLVINGTQVGGAGGYAGEFGQNRPGIASPSDRRASHGVLEDEVSRNRLLGIVGLANADEPTLAAALKASADPAVAEELARQRRILATALSNAINVLNPSLVLLGGFLATVAESAPRELADAVEAQAMAAAFEGVEIRVALLGEDRLLIGAAEIAFEALLADPAGQSKVS
jgi:predicted NBD/HSP70 family sugar kinase